MKAAVIFDMDGVLVQSGHAHMESWRVLARKTGVEFSEADFAAGFGQTSRDIIRAHWGSNLSDEQVKALDDEKEQIYRDLVTGMVPLTIGVRETLGGLAEENVTLAVATSGPRANLDLLLDESDLRPMFAATVTGDDIQHGKPAPDCFLLAAERIDVPPDRCVVVEDAPPGVQAALAAGMPVVGLIGTHSAEVLREAGATRLAQQLPEITAPVVRELLGNSGGKSA